MLATGGLYAPTIRCHDGVVYIVCTNVFHDESEDPKDNKTQNFIISTHDIESNEWSDPIYFDFDGIDPSIFIDDDGIAYIQGSYGPGPWTQIHLFQIDLQTGKKLTEQKNIWQGTGGIYPEGPHIYKKDGFYYLMISEGGTHDDHAIVVARSTDIWGPYESSKHNPILTARGTEEYIQYTGHADMFQDVNGRWWGVCLGVRKDERRRIVMGRETFLTSGDWPVGGWPSLSQVKMDPMLSGQKVQPKSALTAAPMVDYLYIRDAELRNYQFSNDGRTITLTASSADVSQWKEPVTFVGKRQRQLSGNARVSMRCPKEILATNLKAGLAYYKDEHRYIRIFYDFASSKVVCEVVNNAKKILRSSHHGVHLVDSISFRVEYREQSYKFSYLSGHHSTKWVFFDSVDTLDLTGPDFVGPLIGIFATADAQDTCIRFDDLEID